MDSTGSVRRSSTFNHCSAEGGTTSCPGCGEALIRRDWYEVLECALDEHACCPYCGARVSGRFGAIGHAFGRRRIPVRVAAAGGEP